MINPILLYLYQFQAFVWTDKLKVSIPNTTVFLNL